MIPSHITIIRLDAPWEACTVCDAWVPVRWGIPTWEGWVLPHDWTGEWCGQSVCERCYVRQEQITVPVRLAVFRQKSGCNESEQG